MEVRGRIRCGGCGIAATLAVLVNAGCGSVDEELDAGAGDGACQLVATEPVRVPVRVLEGPRERLIAMASDPGRVWALYVDDEALRLVGLDEDGSVAVGPVWIQEEKALGLASGLFDTPDQAAVPGGVVVVWTACVPPHCTPRTGTGSGGEWTGSGQFELFARGFGTDGSRRGDKQRIIAVGSRSGATITAEWATDELLVVVHPNSLPLRPFHWAMFRLDATGAPIGGRPFTDETGAASAEPEILPDWGGNPQLCSSGAGVTLAYLCPRSDGPENDFCIRWVDLDGTVGRELRLERDVPSSEPGPCAMRGDNAVVAAHLDSTRTRILTLPFGATAEKQRAHTLQHRPLRDVASAGPWFFVSAASRTDRETVGRRLYVWRDEITKMTEHELSDRDVAGPIAAVGEGIATTWIDVDSGALQYQRVGCD